VKDQSHKDEMSAAIRGDFQRLRERGVAATLTLRADELPDALPSEPTPAPRDAPTAGADERPAAMSLPSPVRAGVEAEPERPVRAAEPDDPAADSVGAPGPEPAPPQPAAAASADESPARSGLLARLLGR
jgi:hypothetical protein